MVQDLFLAWRLIPHLRRWHWAALVPLGLVAAALESLGAGVVLAVGTIIAEPARAPSLPFVSGIAARLASPEPRGIIVALSASVAAFYVARGLLLTLFTWVQARVVHGTGAEVASRLFRAYLHAPYVFHLRRNSATLIQTAGQSVETVFWLGLGSAVNIAAEGLTLLGLLAMLTIAAPVGTLASVATIGLMLLGPLLITRHLAPRLGGEVKLLNEALTRDLQQSLGSFKEVRVMGGEDHFQSTFAAHRERLATIRARQDTLTTGVRLFVETTFVLAVMLAVVIVAVRGTTGGGLVGLMALYAYAGFRIVPSANRLMLNLTLLQGARPHIHGLSSDLDALEQPRATPPAGVAPEPLKFTDRFEFQSVSYGYEQDRGPALHEVHLTIRRGESVGIVGATGSGKTTLIDVLLGLLEPQSGRVLVDGRDVRCDIRSWQRRVGYVPQGFALLDDTLRRNIAFGHPDSEIDDARVDTALQLAHLAEFVATLPAGLDTILGERGARLSGGERQRVAIARALYHDPDVLVFDEATSALDHRTEQAIVGAIDELRGVKTLVVVAHRLSTVQGCDRLVFLQQGRVTGEGTYETLLARDPAFRGLVSPAAGS